MEAETSISQGIRITDEMAQYDAACKRLLSEKIILAWIMKRCLEVSFVCNLSKGVEERGMARGMAKGIAKGMAEGRAKGVAETTLANIRSLMETMGLTLEQAMAALRVPDEDRAQYAAQLREQ